MPFRIRFPLRMALAGILGCSMAGSSITGRADDSSSPPAITVEEMRWGFDGRTTPRTFTPLSVLLQNQTATPASGQLQLRRTSGGKHTELSLILQYDVPPFEQRWVQFVPYLLDDYDAWRLSWGSGPQESTEVPRPAFGEPAVVLLKNSNELLRRVGSIKRFSTELFPPSLTGMDSLDALVLDSVPDLQGARLQSLLDWIHSGGRIFLLQNETEQFPHFPEALDELNQPAERFVVGRGVVRRLPIRAIDIDTTLLRKTLMSHAPEERPAKRDTAELWNLENQRQWRRDDAILSELEASSRYVRRWWLIYPIAFFYVLSIFPGSFFVGRGVKHVRWFYATFLGSAALFSVAFATLGKVGGGNQNRLRTATIAREFAPGLYDVNQWIGLAAVNGETYLLSHDGSGRCYSTAGDLSVVNGKATLGAEARVELDIPPASTRSLTARFRSSGPELGLRVEFAEFSESKFGALTLAGAALPADLLAAYVVHGDRLYPLRQSGSTFTATAQRSVSVSSFVSSLDQLDTLRGFGSPDDDEKRKSVEDAFSGLDHSLIGNAFGLKDLATSNLMTLRRGLVRVFLFANDQKEFAPVAEAFPDRRGCILYVVDLPVTDN